ncbi:double-stranded RNA-binding protein 1-like [Pyrus ussuriensis x Pyrus communis]|uniref:Double-stranded RNA-binding protein 1-like n=1 Tax=Pyrus ussuriensis x Pyrus communis TaxID=2448454 RepID=A0A5N5GB69_9ROSA|nr:double-stranded RNA-binding protein 1-like [Pyrus ussuriensis x Pyrus communis]
MEASDSNLSQLQLQLSNQPPPQNPTPVHHQFLSPAPVQDQVPAQHPASSASPSASSASASASSSKSLPDHLTHKNRLQEYAQGAGLPLPVYQTVNEGNRHAPSTFRSSVLVDGVCYASSNTFASRKAAEQDAARLAMISITEKIKEEVPTIPPIHEDLVFCKSILNEYNMKRKIEPPTYQTFQGNAKVPFFVSSLVVNGVSYTGDVGKSKKEAEQLAARVVIQSLLGDSESVPIMSEILRSKYKLAHKSKEPDSSHASLATSAVNTGQGYVISTDTPVIVAPEVSLGMHPPRHEFIKRKQEEPASQAPPQLPIAFVPPACKQPLVVVSTSLATTPTSLATTPTSLAPASASLAPASASLAPASASLAPASTSLGPAQTFWAVLPASKKRRKNKKSETNLQNDNQLPAGTLNLNHPASCAASQ